MAKRNFRWTRYALAVKSLYVDHGWSREKLMKNLDESMHALKRDDPGIRPSELAATHASRVRQLDDIIERCNREQETEAGERQ